MAEKTEKWKAARTKNLTAAQMKQARRVVGGKRSEAVSGTERKAAKKAVDISGTKWMKASERGGKGRGGLLVDSSGKAVTGTVTLPSGQKATYVRGKRIGVVAGGGGKGKGQGGGGGVSGGGATKYKPSAAAVKAGAGKRYEERKPSVGAVAARSRKTPGENYRGKPDRLDKPANVSQSVWERMSMAQKAALVGGLVLPVTRVPAIIASGGIAGNYVGTAIKNARNRGKTTKKPTRPLKMTKTYPGGR